VLPSPSARALTALAAARDAAYGTQVDIGNANLRPICRVERVGEHRQRAHWGVEAATHLAPPVGRVTALISAIEIETGITIFNTGVAARKDHCMFIARVCCHSLATVSLSVGIASAQVPPAPYVAPAPILNPSSSLVISQPPPVPVSPGPPLGSLGGYGSNVFGTGEYLRGTNEVVNPPHSVLHHPRRHRHALR
jgi:hypothetical protein